MLKLRSPEPFWLVNDPLLASYPRLESNLRTEVVIIGNGISGALIAYKLVMEGFKVCMVSATAAGSSSTCASTGLLQYDIDTSLHDLIRKIGERDAVESYLLSYRGIDELQAIHTQLNLQHIFKTRASLLLASKAAEVAELYLEFKARRAIGIPVQWLEADQVKNKYGFKAPAAIYSAKAAQTDAYLLCQHLVAAYARAGGLVFESTKVLSVTENAKTITLETDRGFQVKAKYVVVATGYDAVKWIKKPVAQLHSTYAVISKPVRPQEIWPGSCLVWETARPYHYLRTTTDNRVIIGGLDEPFSSAPKRDKLLNGKARQLTKAAARFCPQVPFVPDYAWAGTFAETKDGLPLIGALTDRPRVFYALGYGGNGITFSQLAAGIIANAIRLGKHAPYHPFGFTRLDKL